MADERKSESAEPPAEGASADRQRRLEEVLATFLVTDASGGEAGRQQLLAEHPDLADELAAFFQDHDRMRQWAEPAWTTAQGSLARPPGIQPSVSPTAAPSGDQPSDQGLGAATRDRRAHAPSGALPCRFGDYELLEELGRGGMGVVYKARQLSLHRTVAVKMIHARCAADPAAVPRFHAEAKSAAKLQHANIVQVYEVGQHEGQPFFSMQYVEGQNLAQLLQQTPLTPKRAARYVEQISRAVAHAHEHGVLHRDLKPSNVLIDAHDQPRVMDFGLAKQLESEEQLTVSGQLVGTPAYMSPEQAAARRDKIGPASDIYALGVVLFELLTGQPPFRGTNAWETLRLVRESDPRLPRTLNPQVPRDLEMICLKCLEKDPRDRYAGAAALAEDLQRYLDGDSISISSLSLFERVARTLERGSLDLEFRAWRRILHHFAWIILLAHVVLFVLELRWWKFPWTVFAAVRSAEYAAMGLVLWLLRRQWYPPRGGPARQILALWLAFVAGSVVLHVISPFEGRNLYPQYAVLASLGFFMMGSGYWGYCYLIGILFLALAMFMTWVPWLAALVFGCAWAASLLAVAKRLGELAEER